MLEIILDGRLMTVWVQIGPGTNTLSIQAID